MSADGLRDRTRGEASNSWWLVGSRTSIHEEGREAGPVDRQRSGLAHYSGARSQRQRKKYNYTWCPEHKNVEVELNCFHLFTVVFTEAQGDSNVTTTTRGNRGCQQDLGVKV
ncbi:hypothetical protein NDU88_005059 [Pleurodeles waltl]|uniref:Uncharacterized protein n=1 Tax=Pleurodeles waltl TaxID=8319 RepID=A0AAV7L3P7_PLEWA|nr:hypothetical protein NDU88_005059 [Pleurodeles waltl]